MLLTHRKPRADQNAPTPEPPATRATAQTLLRRIHLALGKGPIKTAPRAMRG